MEEHIASCGYCTWEVSCPTEERKVAVELSHADRWHAELAPPVDELCEAIVEANPNDFELVVSAFRAAAARHDGEVDQNFVRAILPRGLNPRVVSAAYRVCRARARNGQPGLVKVGTNVSDDVTGRNAGREQPLYRWVEVERSQTA